MKKLFTFLLICCLCTLTTMAQDTWDSSIAQLFVDNGCTGCHGAQGGLNLTTYAGISAGGNKCGTNLLTGGNLVGTIVTTGYAGCGTPIGGASMNDRVGGQFDSAELSQLQAWIDAGAPESSAPGCLDPVATNFNPDATEEDGSCQYLCAENNLIPITNNTEFGQNGGYGLAGGMGLASGSVDAFGGFIWNIPAGLDIAQTCMSIDMEVTGDAAAFPVTLEFRVENNDCGFFPCPWNDFNIQITGPGTYTLGGDIIANGNMGGNGPFDPNGINPAIVAAIAYFPGDGTPFGGDVNITFSNMCISDGNCVSEPVTCDISCPAGEVPSTVDYTFAEGFDSGSGLAYGSTDGFSMGLLDGALNDFGGNIFNVDLSGLAQEDVCTFIDMTVTGDASAFPITLEYRVENNIDCDGCNPSDTYNQTITGPGTYTLGGNLAAGVNANGGFDITAGNARIITAIAYFPADGTTTLNGGIDVTFSNLIVTDGTCEPQVDGCTDPAALNYDANANTDDGSCTYTNSCPTVYLNDNNLPSLPDALCTGDLLELCFDLLVDETTFDVNNIAFTYELTLDGALSSVPLNTTWSPGTQIDANANGQVCFSTTLPEGSDSCNPYDGSLNIQAVNYNDADCPNNAVAYDLNLSIGLVTSGDDLNTLIPLLALQNLNPINFTAYPNPNWSYEVATAPACDGATLGTINILAADGTTCATLTDIGTAGMDGCPSMSAMIPASTYTAFETYESTDADGNPITVDNPCAVAVNILEESFACAEICPGCTNPAACNYNPDATSDDGSCQIPMAASISSDISSICVGDAEDIITITINDVGVGENSVFIITDEGGTNILGVQSSGDTTFDLSGAPGGICQIWLFNYYGTYETPTSNLVADIAVCGVLSNQIDIARNEPTADVTEDGVICTGGSYTASSGTTYTASGSETLTDANGCDYTLTVNITENTPIDAEESATICAGESYAASTGTSYTASGSETIIDANGCEATLTVTILVNEPLNTSESGSVCSDGSNSYTSAAGVEYNMAGSYDEIFVDANGCTATNTVTVTEIDCVDPCDAVNDVTETANVCPGDTYTASTGTSYTESGSETIGPDENGCSYTLFVEITNFTPQDADESATICAGESYTASTGTSYTASGSETITDANGCEATLTVTILVNEPMNETESGEVCSDGSTSFTSSTGKVYTTAGTYEEAITDANGCVATNTVTITAIDCTDPCDAVSDQTEDATICEGDSYTASTGTVYTASGSETVGPDANGCSYTLTITLTVNTPMNETESGEVCSDGSTSFTSSTGEVYTTAGTYEETITDANGCAATNTVTITATDCANPCDAVSDQTETAVICAGETYTASTGTEYTESGSEIVLDANDCSYTLNVELTINTPMAATISADVSSVCVGNAEDLITVTVNDAGMGENTVFVITDNGGTNILGTQEGNVFDLSGAPAGTCQLWLLNYYGDIELPSSGLVADLDVCGALSNPIDIVREECSEACADFAVETQVICFAQNQTYQVAVVIVGGSGSYSVDTGNGAETVEAVGGQAYILTDAAPEVGSYSITVEDVLNGCSYSTNGAVDCTTTAIELLDFSAKVEERGNELNWVTASEFENDFFVIMKSTDAENFEPIAQITAIGNSNTPQAYNFLDEDVANNKAYYRLDALDINGDRTSSDVIEVERTTHTEMSIYPIPATNFINIDMIASQADNMVLTVFDVSGKAVLTVQVEINAGVNVINLDISNLGTGVYFIAADAKTINLRDTFIVK